MKSDESKVNRIPASAGTKAVPWQLPEVTGSHIVALETKKEPSNSGLNARVLEAVQPNVGLVIQREKPQEDVVTVSQAEEIRQAAYQEGLLQGLVEGREKGFPEGLEKGMAEGREKGFEQARLQGQAKIDQAVANLAKMVQSMERPLADQEQQLESLLSELVVKLASTTLDAELKTRPELLQNTIKRALSQLPQGSGGDLKIKVSPADLAHVEAIVDLLSFNVSVIGDGSISLGSFELKSSNTLVVSDIRTQFDHLSAQLFASLTSNDTDA